MTIEPHFDRRTSFQNLFVASLGVGAGPGGSWTAAVTGWSRLNRPWQVIHAGSDTSLNGTFAPVWSPIGHMATDVAVDGAGNTFQVGRAPNPRVPSTVQGVITKRTASGTQVWELRLPGFEEIEAVALAQDPGSGTTLYLAARKADSVQLVAYTDPGATAPITTKWGVHGATGAGLRMNWTPGAETTALMVHGSKLYRVGRKGRDAEVEQYDRSTGIRGWRDAIGPSDVLPAAAATDKLTAQGVSVDESGRAHVVGWVGKASSTSFSTGQTFLARYGSGDQPSRDRLNLIPKLTVPGTGTSAGQTLPGETFGRDLVATDRGVTMVGGVRHGSGTSGSWAGSQSWMARFDADGQLLHQSAFHLSGYPKMQEIHGVEQLADRSLVLAGVCGATSAQTWHLEGAAWLAVLKQQPDVVHQFGSEADDAATALAVAGDGSVYVGGWTQGKIGDDPSSGGDDIWLSRRDSNGRATGSSTWTKQFGSWAQDQLADLVLDGSDHLIAVGSTNGELADGRGGQGITDGWLARVSTTGAERGRHQFGTTGNTQLRAVAVGAKPGGTRFMVVAGSVAGDLEGTGYQGGTDGFVARYDPTTLTRTWVVQLRTRTFDDATVVAIDNAGNVIVAGSTDMQWAGLGDADVGVWIAKYDGETGQKLWETRPTEVDKGVPTGLGFQGNKLYLVGQTFARRAAAPATPAAAPASSAAPAPSTTPGTSTRPPSPPSEVWVASYGLDRGDPGQRETYKSDEVDLVAGLAMRRDGTIVVAGTTAGALARSADGSDVWVMEFGNGVKRSRLLQFGSNQIDACLALAATGGSGSARLHLAGMTLGRLDGQGQPPASSEAWVARIDG